MTREEALKKITDFGTVGGECFIDGVKAEGLSDKDLFFIADQCERGTKELWHKKYKARLIAQAGVTDFEAEQCLQGGMGMYDYSDDPQEAADTEMSYWAD